jgi:hypothetical protein
MPFGEYKNFAECVRKNSGKKDPKAYCATIMKAVEEDMDQPIQVHNLILDVSEAEFAKDETTGKMTAHVRIIKSGRAKGKNRDYTSTALRRAVKEGVYNGIRMYVDHSDQTPLKRKITELVSAVEGTTYNAREDAIEGDVEFFNEEFFNYAQRAKKHIGLSADHRIRVSYVREGKESIEKVQQVVDAKSVDWVVYPAAGGEILKFARESEGADDVEWSEITPDLLKEKAPEIYAAILAAKESAGPDDEPDDDEDEGGEGNKGKVKPAVFSKADIAKMVKEAIESDRREFQEQSDKITAASKATKDYVGKSGLPARTQARIVTQFLGETEFVEADVKEAVDEAKLELKEAGAGPRVSGMGSSGSEGGELATSLVGAREAVESFFMGPKKSKKTGDASKENE